MVADEDGAGVFYPAEVGAGVDGEVLGGEAVGELAGFINRFCDEDVALGLDGLHSESVAVGLAFGF